MTGFLNQQISRELVSTSADSPMMSQTIQQIVSITMFPSLEKTISGESIADWDLLHLSDRTTNGFTVAQVNISATTPSALNELKKLSGLTWEQLAKLFNVSRRSLHFWASGQPISRFNQESLYRLLETLRYINRGNADINRHNLLNPGKKNQIPFDLLVAGQYEDVKKLLGRGGASHNPPLIPLSKEEFSLRTPQKPGVLGDALQDSAHKNVGRSRPARAARSRNGT